MFVEDVEYLDFFKKNNLQKNLDKLAQKYKDKTIIVYGIGKDFELIYQNYDFSKLNIIGFADIKFKNGKEYHNLPTFDAYSFMEKQPDVVIIGALGVERIMEFFEKELVPKYGKFKVDSIFKISIWKLLKMLIS